MNNSELPPYDPLEPAPETTRQYGNAQQATPAKKSGVTAFLVFIIIVLLLAGAGAGAYIYINQNQPVDTELRAYEALEGCEDLAEYESYLELYPESPRVREVKERYLDLKKMYDQWREVTASDRLRDYALFLRNYPNSSLASVCDQKIDSIDWAEAQAKGGEEAIAEYLKKHPNGRYASEAQEAHSKIMDATPTTEEKLMIEETLRGFYSAFGTNDIQSVYTYITPSMTRFLQKENATKADVAEIIERTYNEHIMNCRFALNNDTKVKKIGGADNEDVFYKVSFSVDQHIERDNEGKTFGSYTAEATINSQFKLTSLTMKEVSRR